MNARGGVDDLSGRFLGGPASGLATIGVLLVGLGILIASPHPVVAQGECTNADDPGTPPVLTLDSASTYTSDIQCTGLTGGLTLDFNGAQIGQSATMPITGSRAFNINAEVDGNSDIEAMGRVTIYSQGTGIRMSLDGTGSLKLELEKDSVINASGNNQYGIHLEHRGEAKTGTETGVTKGINLVSNAKVVLSGLKTDSTHGVYVRTNRPKAGTTIPITIHLAGGSIRTEVADKQRGQGINVGQYAKGDITITVDSRVMIGTKDKPIGAFGIGAGIETTGVGTITIKHLGEIYAVHGINAYMEGPESGSEIKGDIVIETGADSKIVTHRIGESSSTTYNASGAYPLGIEAFIRGDDRIGNIKITHRGMIDAARIGIRAYGNRAVTVTLEKGSRIKAKEIGIHARTYATGIVTVKMEAGSTVAAERHGIQVDQRGTDMRKFDVAVHGTVMGGNVDDDGNKYAGVHIRKQDQTVANKIGGGTLVIGHQARVEATSGVAIQVDAKAGDVEVILEQDEAGLVGHVKGQILNPAAKGDSAGTTRSTLEFKTRSVSGSETVLTPDAADAIIYRRGERTGVYEEVIKAQLTTIAGKGYKFEDDTTVSGLRLYSHRSRLYEVLPSVLLGLVDLTPYSTRMAVPRRTTGDEEVMVQSSKGEHVAVPGSRTGVWVRLAVRDGERMADTSTTAQDIRRQSLAWDVKQTDFEAGLEVPTDERLVLGVSAHYRQSEATVKNGGTMEASGTGVGVSLTWTDDSGLYVDGQLSYTRFFDITMVSANSAVGAITSTGGGSGLALGVEVGQPMSIGGMAVTPRGGLSWSSVDMDAFDEPTRIDGAGLVAPDKEQSVQGRVGVLAELGPKDADRRLYASLDLEHEFSSKHAVMVAGTRLETEVKPTWVRLGVGGAMSLGSGDTTMLTGDAFYATAGSDNTDFGGGLSVTFRF